MFEEIKAIVAENLGADKASITPETSFSEDLKADSLDLFEMVMAFENGGYPCKVLGASFRTADQIRRLATVGCQAVTITPEMFDLLIAHASTDASMEGFRKAWKETFGEKQVSDFIPE